MSLRLQHLLDAVDAMTKVDPTHLPDFPAQEGEKSAEQLLRELQDAWTHLPDDKLLRLIKFIEHWAEASNDDSYDIAYNLLLAWDSYKDATK